MEKGDGVQCTLVPVPEVVCLECGRHFSAKRGLGVHSRTAHPKAYHSKQTASIGAAIGAQTKRRWDDEELAGMAMEEARLRRKGVKTINAGKGVATVNATLAALMPDRTLESIKGQRRRPEYKSLVESYMSTSPEETVVPGRTTHRSPSGKVQVSPSTTGGTTVVPTGEISTQEATTPRCAARAAVSASPGPQLLSPGPGEKSAREETTPSCAARAAGGASPGPQLLSPGPTIAEWDVKTPTRVNNRDNESSLGADVPDWRTPVRAAILAQAREADVCPELLEHALQLVPLGTDCNMQELIDRDLLGLLPPAERHGHGQQHQPPRQEARTARAQRRADYAKVQSLYKTSRYLSV